MDLYPPLFPAPFNALAPNCTHSRGNYSSGMELATVPLRPNASALSVLSSRDIRSRVSNKLGGGGLRSPYSSYKGFFHHTAFSKSPAQF
ncbi:hypothetical protein CEXT_648051 [Caerostris extrusa]|uniref:Uncharacterized protein n=1 Tax=Caerostris extrusa TaxID=172846 RepID=A0AAV4XZD4_CAEEX|nr:hypothetical protein CEXT_648051 [Caerostris extrusa]